MIIKLWPQRRDDTLTLYKSNDTLIINGYAYNFTNLAEGSTLPSTSIASQWFFGDVSRTNGEIVLTLTLPNPLNYSAEQAFPTPLVNVPDGPVVLPRPLPDENGQYPEVPQFDPATGVLTGVIDWSQVVTKAMRDAAIATAQLAAVKAELAARNSRTTAQIARIQDRIDTIGYGIDAGEATEEDEAEQAALMISIKAWKAYKFALGKVSTKPSWPANPEWPVEPAIPEIAADPMARAAEDA